MDPFPSDIIKPAASGLRGASIIRRVTKIKAALRRLNFPGYTRESIMRKIGTHRSAAAAALIPISLSSLITAAIVLCPVEEIERDDAVYIYT